MNVTNSLKDLVSGVFAPEEEVNKKNTINDIMSRTIINPVKRSKLWELHGMYHCPIVGVCLPMSDLERLATRFKLAANIRDEYQLHIEAVDKCNTRNKFSEAVQKLLDKKYRQYINEFNKIKTADEVQALWKEQYANGKGPVAMWPLLTHKAVNEAVRNIIYADMHMLSHQTGAGQAADMNRLNRLEHENHAIKKELEQRKQKYGQAESNFQKKINQANQQLQDLQQTKKDMQVLQERITAFESGEAMVNLGRQLATQIAINEQLRASANRNKELDAELKSARIKIDTLIKERDLLVVERDALENLLQDDMQDDEQTMPMVSPDECDERQTRCILCVGGRVSLLPQYRALAKKLGFKLIHHDGGQEEALSRLPDMMNQAKAVICPTDCVGHVAYYQLKRYCKLNNKPCLLFKGAGVSSFAKALSNLSDQHSQTCQAIEHKMQ